MLIYSVFFFIILLRTGRYLSYVAGDAQVSYKHKLTETPIIILEAIKLNDI